MLASRTEYTTIVLFCYISDPILPCAGLLDNTSNKFLIARPLSGSFNCAMCFGPRHSPYLCHAPEIGAVGTIFNVYSNDAVLGWDLSSSLPNRQRADALPVTPQSWRVCAAYQLECSCSSVSVNIENLFKTLDWVENESAKFVKEKKEKYFWLENRKK